MARDEEIIYGSYTIGGSSGPNPIERFDWTSDHARATFSVDFVIMGSTYGNLETACTTAETALLTRRQRLRVKFSSTTFKDYNPTLGAGTSTGFNITTSLQKLRNDRLSSGYARRYRFTAVVDLPQSDQSGRLDEDWSVHYDLENRRVVTISGVYRQDGANTAYAQYVAQIDSHATSILNTVDNTASWVLAEKEAEPNDPNTDCRYRHVYWEVVSGRRNSRTQIDYSPAGGRLVTITGTYVKTSGTAALSLYTSNEDTHSAAVLTALGIASTDREKISEQVAPNEKDESLSFRRQYRELIHQQSSGSTDDSEVIFDEIVLDRVRFPTNDSPSPAPIRGAAAFSGGAPGSRDKSLDITGEVEVPAKGPTEARPMIDLVVQYSAWIVKTNTNLRGKWDSSLRGHLITMVSSKLGLYGAAVENEDFQADPVQNRIQVALRMKAMDGALISFRVSDSYTDTTGLRLSPVLSGRPHEYVVQEGFPEKKRRRRIEAIYVTGGFNPMKLFTPADAREGWVLEGRSIPVIENRVFGATNSDLGQVEITRFAFEEEFTFVARAITRSGSGSGSAPGGAAGARA